MIQLVIIDRKDSERRATETILSTHRDLRVVATGADGYEALRLADLHKPDMLLLDIELSYLDGLKAASILSVRYPRMAMLVLTSLQEERHIRTALNSGVAGYLFKHKHLEKLADAIRIVHSSGCLIFPRGTLGLLRGEPRGNADRQFPSNLSKVDLQIIRHIGGGLENQEIAEKLRLKMGTVRNHISAILQKTGLRNRTQLAVFALQHGLENALPVA